MKKDKIISTYPFYYLVVLIILLLSLLIVGCGTTHIEFDIVWCEVIKPVGYFIGGILFLILLVALLFKPYNK